MSSQGSIAAGHALTARSGADVLRDGGNAVDAAIAAVAMACVCEPVLCSPGGGAFAMVRETNGSTHLIDAFVHTPRMRANELRDGSHDVVADFGTTRQSFRIGPATTATPGLFDGLHTLADRFGTAPRLDLVNSAASAARAGVSVTPFQHHLSTVVEPILTATVASRALFAPDDRLLAAGEKLINPGLADALELLACSGFGASEVGRAAIAQQAERGHLTLDDLDHYTVIDRAPLTIDVDDDIVHLNPLPAAGGVLVADTLGRIHTGSPLEIARALDATDRARRSASGDLAHLSPTLQRRRGTTHVSVVDSDGMACSITASNGEGNGEIVDGFGFMLNNVLGESDVNPHGDGWPTDTRLSSMMCPTIIEHGDGAVTALGTGGSSRIRSAISQVVAALCCAEQDLDRAIGAPRIHVADGHLDVEPGHQHNAVEAMLAAFPDHRIWPRPDLYFGGVHAAQRRLDGSLVGVGDARRGGAGIIALEPS